MAIYRRRIVACAVKVQATEGTDATPAAGTDAVAFVGIPTLTIGFAEDGNRNDVQFNGLGIAGRAQPQGRWGAIELTLEYRGKGSAYAALPASAAEFQHDPFLRMAGFSRSYATGVVTYADAETGLELGTLYLWDGAQILYRLIDCVAKPKLALVAGQVVRITYAIEGTLSTDPVQATVSGLVLPTTIIPPVWGGNATFALGAWSQATAIPNRFAPRKVELDFGTMTTRRPWAGADSLMANVVVDRKPKLTLDVEAVSLATFDPFAQAKLAKSPSDTDTQFTAAWGGAVVGNTCGLALGTAQLAPPKSTDLGGLSGWTLEGELIARSLAGANCIKLTIA